MIETLLLKPLLEQIVDSQPERKSKILRELNLTFSSLGFAFGLPLAIGIISEGKSNSFFVFIYTLVGNYLNFVSTEYGYLVPILGVLLCLSSLVISFLDIITINTKDRLYIFISAVLASLGLVLNLLTYLIATLED